MNIAVELVVLVYNTNRNVLWRFKEWRQLLWRAQMLESVIRCNMAGEGWFTRDLHLCCLE